MNPAPNTQQVRELANALNADAIVAMSPENFAYTSGSFVLTVGMIRPRQAFVVIPRNHEPVVVACSIEKSLLESESWIKDQRYYTEFVDNPIDALLSVLRELKLDRGRIGIDADYMPASTHERLAQSLPHANFFNSTEEIAKIRAIKTPDEVSLLERATKQTHQAVLDAMAASKLGDTERDMANRIANNIINNGSDGTLFLCFASGPRSNQSHAHATDRVPQPGEIIRFDVGGTYGAWASDFARTYSSGSPSQLQVDTHARLVDLQAATIDMIRPGVTAEDVFYFCKDQFAKARLEFHMPHIGHSFGVELHENPMLRPGDKTVIRPGMVLNIEPIAKDSEGSLYHTEDLIVVTDSGSRLLTLGLAPRKLPVIGEPLSAQV